MTSKRSKAYHWFLAVFLLLNLIFLAISTIFFILGIQSQYHSGLDDSLCRCEQFHDNRAVEARIVNGTEFTNRGLSWIVSIYHVEPEQGAS